MLKASKNQDGSSDQKHKLPAIQFDNESNLNIGNRDSTPKNGKLKVTKNMNVTYQQESTNDDSYVLTDSKLSKYDNLANKTSRSASSLSMTKDNFNFKRNKK